ncbi:hypothetical protein CMV_020464 [Castanea mollissima]|uniref:Uncharacterized protein n=1 Tax=Castanea mollissima TaxID=60419 RepID=A0A8J4QQN0_9ROSI|nr:hypothetical protein CMV_020464 [Castanea mollissima]
MQILGPVTISKSAKIFLLENKQWKQAPFSKRDKGRKAVDVDATIKDAYSNIIEQNKCRPEDI